MLLLLLVGLTAVPMAALAQDAATEEAAPAATDEAVTDDAAATGETATDGAAVGDAAAPAGDADPFDQAALPTISDEELNSEVFLPPLGFLLEMFHKGGNFMWPLLIASIIGFAVIIERAYTLTRAKVNTRQLVGEVVNALREGGATRGIEDAKEICQRTRGPIAAILHAGLARANKGPEAVEKAIESAGTIEMSFLQRGLIVLASIANVAPLLGFLGTVSGMINAFEAIAQAEQVSAKLVATGISEALITTASGLIVAIPIQLANNFFISRIDRFVLEMEEASVELVDTLVDMEHHHVS
jgi:biopolymer transport protein ExbB